MKIITVTLNPCIDVTLITDGFDIEKVNHVQRGIRQAGGKGINVGTVARNFSVETKAFSIIGSQNKDEFLKLLGTSAGEIFYIEKYGKVRENYTMRFKDATMKFNSTGLVCTGADLDRLFAGIKCAVDAGDIVAICGSIPNGIEDKDFKDFCVDIARLGVKVFLDSENCTLDDIKDIKPFCIKPNKYELAQLFDIDKDLTESEIENMAKQLGEMGVENVLVTLGGDGTIACCSGKIYRVSAPEIEVRSSVGAGDSMLAGFAIGISKGYDIERALRFASACGSDTASREGSELCLPESVNSLLDQVMIK